jgi:replication factor C large subunit
MELEFQNWTEKYRVKSFSEIKGHDLEIREIKNFFNKFPSGKRAILISGPPGTGKTTFAYALSNEFNLEIFELNASDFRNREHLEEILKPASEQKSLFKKGKILLIDEVDGLSSRDAGGLPELISLIDTSSFPMVITANDAWDQKFSTLRKKCMHLQLKEIDYKVVTGILQEIAKKENLEIDNSILISIAIRSRGDIRAAINDFQTLTANEESIKKYLTIDERNRTEDIFNVLKVIFKSKFNSDFLELYSKVDMPLEKIFLWIEENIPYEYKGEELYNAYEALSLADVYRGRIRRQRHWRFLVYQNIFLSAGISLAKKSPKTGFTHYQKPTRILKIWMNNNKYQYKKSIVSKYSRKIHCSKRKAMKEFEIIKPLLRNQRIQKELDMSEKEIEYITEG